MKRIKLFDKSEQYNDHNFRTAFWLEMSYSIEGVLSYVIITEYFIDDQRVKFKGINDPSSKLNVTIEQRLDTIVSAGIDPIRDYLDTEIDRLKDMYKSDLTEQA